VVYIYMEERLSAWYRPRHRLPPLEKGSSSRPGVGTGNDAEEEMQVGQRSRGWMMIGVSGSVRLGY